MLTSERNQKHAVPASNSSVTWSDGSIVIHNPRSFGMGDSASCERFLRRVFTLHEIRSVAVDRSNGTAELRHLVDPAGLPHLLGRLAQVIRVADQDAEAMDLPCAIDNASFTVHRHGAILTTWNVAHDGAGRLRLVHDALCNRAELAQKIERDLGGVSGVVGIQVSPRTGSVLIQYDPLCLTAARLIAFAEEALRAELSRSPMVLHSDPSRFVMVNTTLAVAAIVEFVTPVLMPVSAVLLVATNLKHFKVAWLQVRHRQLGLPVLYTTIMATTLLTGQFLASAIMTWLFRFWHRRFRVEMTSERTRLLDTAVEPLLARLVLPHGGELLVDLDRVVVGDRIVIEAGETVPVDGTVLLGEGVVDERDVQGWEGVTRKRLGDQVLAGSTLIAGKIAVHVESVGTETRASSIRRVLVAATSPTPGAVAPTLRSETYASKAVGPTLATAGVGLLTGDLLAVGAILRPDYATGPSLAVSLETLRDVAISARRGIIALRPEMFERMAQVDVVVFDDHPCLERPELEVAHIQTRLAEAVLLRHATSAFRHMDDDRATALVTLCRQKHVHILNLEAVEFDPSVGVTVIAGKRRVRVRERDSSDGLAGPLVVEVDGIAVGLIEFQLSSRPEAASALRLIREFTTAPFLLVSSRNGSKVAALAESLGVDSHQSGLSIEQTANLLRELRDRGFKTAFVADCHARAEVAREAHVAISLSSSTAELDSGSAGFVIPQCRIAPLASLFEISNAHAGRVRDAHTMILLPNLLCIAGAFLFGFTGMTAVMISNLGTFGLYRRASGALHELEPSPSRRLSPKSLQAH